MDIVSGLEQGANDYITKPFSLAVLRARVNTSFEPDGADAERKQKKKKEGRAVSGSLILQICVYRKRTGSGVK